MTYTERLETNAEDFDGIITDLLRRLQYLESRNDFLQALEMQGVDNWEGYDEALDYLDSKEGTTNE